MANKRIIELEADTSYENDDWLAIDGATNGTRKIQFKDIFDKETVFDDLAEEYDSSHTYNTFDFCIHEDEFYKCKEDNVTGAWNSAKWDIVSVGEILKSLKTDIQSEATSRSQSDTTLQGNINNLSNETIHINSNGEFYVYVEEE